MNEVMCLAEGNGIKCYYQDTDSRRLSKNDAEKLSELYFNKYGIFADSNGVRGRELICNKLGQFHDDFPQLNGQTVYSVKGLYVGKKAYIDKVMNMRGDIGCICRLKGVKQEFIEITASSRYPQLSQVTYSNGMFIPDSKSEDASIMQLYEDLYNGVEIEFDLCSGTSPCFDMKHNFSVGTKDTFIQKLKF
jgi:hypothetical protein